MMKLRKILLFTVLLTSTSVYAQKNIEWEYLSKTIKLYGDEAATKELNTLGRQGWELIACPFTGVALNCVFKRKK